MIGRHAKCCPYPTVAELDADTDHDARMRRVRHALAQAMAEDGRTPSDADVSAKLDEVLAAANLRALAERILYLLDE